MYTVYFHYFLKRKYQKHVKSISPSITTVPEMYHISLRVNSQLKLLEGYMPNYFLTNSYLFLWGLALGR